MLTELLRQGSPSSGDPSSILRQCFFMTLFQTGGRLSEDFCLRSSSSPTPSGNDAILMKALAQQKAQVSVIFLCCIIQLQHVNNDTETRIDESTC